MKVENYIYKVQPGKWDNEVINEYIHLIIRQASFTSNI